MQVETVRSHLLSHPGGTEDYPFGPDAMVFKVMGKMYALLAWEEDPLRITLKCDPDDAMALRDQYPAVEPGYYMNKQHWNTVVLDGSLPDDLISQMIDQSYQLVVKGLKRADREALSTLSS